MKKILLIIMFANVVCINSIMAGVRFVSGSLAALIEERAISIKIDYKDAVFGGRMELKDFLSLAPRAYDWEAQSMEYFLQSYNEAALGRNIPALRPKEELRYCLLLKVEAISKDGGISGHAYLMDTQTEEQLAVMLFISEDEDDDDEIAMRDQLESIGAPMARLLNKEIKRCKKLKRKQQKQ